MRSNHKDGFTIEQSYNEPPPDYVYQNQPHHHDHDDHGSDGHSDYSDSHNDCVLNDEECYNRYGQFEQRFPCDFTQSSCCDSWAESENNDATSFPERIVQVGGSLNGAEEITPSPRRRRSWKKITCAVICCIIIPLIIILPVLYLVQRDVTFDIVPINIEEETINIDPNGFSIPVTPTVHTKNENFFDITLTNIDVKGSHPAYAQGLVPLGYGNTSGVVLPKRSETDFQFPFMVQYSRSSDTGIVYFSQLLTNCTNPDPNGRNLYLDISVDISYDMWARSGTISEVRNILVPCPISSEQAARIQRLIGSGILSN